MKENVKGKRLKKLKNSSKYKTTSYRDHCQSLAREMLLVAKAFFFKTLTGTVEAFNDLMTIKRNKQILHI